MPDRYTDPHTGELIVPGKPEECAGNVERGGHSCDECDHFLHCFPECDPDNDIHGPFDTVAELMEALNSDDDDEKIDRVADEILHKYRRAFEELAK